MRAMHNRVSPQLVLGGGGNDEDEDCDDDEDERTAAWTCFSKEICGLTRRIFVIRVRAFTLSRMLARAGVNGIIVEKLLRK